ncbi:putative E3 ubiquitin-protein ligase [Lunasporangiospora selenospora]|uniref:HECT-type E3 ubiquitin transferase n=1 Tax=Lunasporangiospora selenospora TaxID=979761 RepID=A0A9P6FSD6_9FUNG|nr:putative E3 ubiquitin-protein ligase [Lunasporangiospora selenospora]
MTNLDLILGTAPREPLTLQQILDGIQWCDARRESDYVFLENLLKEKLRKFAGFNSAFGSGLPITYEHCGVDLEAARKAFSLLVTMPNAIALAVMTSVEGILKRPGKDIKEKEDLKFIMIMLECPWLSRHKTPQESEYHHNITKRLFTIISNLPSELHKYLSSWFSHCLLEPIFYDRINFVNKFITQRLSNQQKSNDRNQHTIYQSDARIQAAARVMHLFFKANQPNEKELTEFSKQQAGDSFVIIPYVSGRDIRVQKIPIDKYYNVVVDFIELAEDFKAWESRSAMFTFCQYPFLISMGAKMQIMAWDAKRQMEITMQKTIDTLLRQKRRRAEESGDASYLSVLTQGELQQAQLLILRVNRNNLIEESLTQLSKKEADLKKSLRIEFIGEDGVDAGGLRKEWFLLLVRQLFDPQYGMFVYDDQSQYCWFNPASFESHDQFYLVGVVIGLAIYNSTILDLPLPLAVYKKLLNKPIAMEDLAAFRPDLAKGFDQLLQYEGDDVEDVFCLTFVGAYEAYGESIEVPLIPNGDNIPVTHLNKRQYVERYANFIMNSSIKDQFESFRRGFYLVCGGHALSLFWPQEIESLVRGSAEPLDIDQLRSVTVYEGFNDNHEVIRNFWSIFKEFDDRNQRRLLQFITASDRYPATGIANLSFKITCMGGQDSNRYPTTHTCFNQLCLYNYKGRDKLKNMLIRAMDESEGFGVK